MKEGLGSGSDGRARCWWCLGNDLYESYHDDEWGVPTHDDIELFERLALESFQAGLSWSTILNKREGYRRAFSGFDPGKVARAYVAAKYDSAVIARLFDRGCIEQHGEGLWLKGITDWPGCLTPGWRITGPLAMWAVATTAWEPMRPRTDWPAAAMACRASGESQPSCAARPVAAIGLPSPLQVTRWGTSFVESDSSAAWVVASGGCGMK